MTMGPSYTPDEDYFGPSPAVTMPPSPQIERDPPSAGSSSLRLDIPDPNQTSPGPHSPLPKPRKQVGWAPAGELPKRPSLGRHHSDTIIFEHSAIPEASEPSHEDLKREISRIFAHSPEASIDASSPQSRTPVASSRPKSVLRSGNATPLIRSPPPELVDDDPNRAGKERSAQAAHQRATTLIDDLNSTLADREDQPSRGRLKSKDRPSRPSSRSRSRKRDSWFGFYNDDADTLASGQSTPDYDPTEDYVPHPSKYRAGPLSLKFRLMNNWASFAPKTGSESRATSPGASPRNSINPPVTPSVSHLVGTSNTLASPARPGLPRVHTSDSVSDVRRPSLGRRRSSYGSGFPFPKLNILKPSSRAGSFDEAQIRIQKHVQDVSRRQRYLIKLCRSLMAFGAPTHRLEEYMKMSARVLEIQAQFLYVPGCMIMSFDDPGMHTTEVKLVRVSQGVDLGKLWDTHAVYKDVVHDKVGVEEATERLDELLHSPDKFRTWFLVLMHGVASAMVAPFAFGAKYPDLGPAFLLGGILGFLRLVVAPRSVLYTDVFEIFAVAITSFLARLFGSLPGQYFCFSALAQSSIALILPGFHVMCAALELQSKSMVAGAVRMVYAIIFSLFIGFGVTIGTVVYGFIAGDDAVSYSTCSYTKHAPIGGYQPFIFVIIYSICLMIVNQAKWKNMPIMGTIAFFGYLVNYFCAKRFAGNSQISSTIAAITLSVLANLYGRMGQRAERVSLKLFRWFHRVILVRVPFLKTLFKLEEPEEIRDDGDAEKQERSEGQPGLLKRLYYAITNVKTTNENDEEVGQAPAGASAEAHQAQFNDDQDDNRSTSGDTTRNNSVTTLVNGEGPSKPKYRASNYSLAAAAMLPGIFVLVPGGISASGSLVQGIATADEISRNATSADAGSLIIGGGGTNSVAFTVSLTVVQVAVGITVGLFIGSIVVYPFGKGGWRSKKMRSGLFSF